MAGRSIPGGQPPTFNQLEVHMSMYGIPKEERELAEEMAQAVLESFLPRSRATNAYDLLNDVIGAIEAEPLRYDQSSWYTSIQRGLEFVREDEKELPNCGTMACVAGWAVVMKRRLPEDVMSTARVAADLLGFNWNYPVRDYDEDGNLTNWYEEPGTEVQATRDIRDLFDDNLGDYLTDEEREMLDRDDLVLEQGTKLYATVGVRKIRAFMAIYSERLRAKVLDAN